MTAAHVVGAPLPDSHQAWSIGIPAHIDGDPAEERALSNLLTTLHEDIEARSARRAQLYANWITAPSLPLEYGTWLLLGRDPLASEAPSQDLIRRFGWALNLLTCEVVVSRLKPVGKAVNGFPRHFRLDAIAMAARRIQLETAAAAQILELGENTGQESQPALPWQTERINRRMAIHTRLIEHYRSTRPGIITTLAPKKASKRYRRGDVTPLNALVFMRACVYDEAFRELYERTYGGAPEYHLTADMLRVDRDQLNVKFKGGRPANSSGQAPTRR